MPNDPFARLDLEFGLIALVGSLRSIGALLGAAQTVDVKPADLSALLDLATEKAIAVQKMAGF